MTPVHKALKGGYFRFVLLFKVKSGIVLEVMSKMIILVSALQNRFSIVGLGSVQFSW